ncbi:MAG: glycosyltransferase family 2 protein [Pseudomonadales bacterium]
MKISVVTPSFNQAKFIERTLQSVLNQGVPDLEYIVVDGGSDDGTVQILERYRPALTHLIIEPDDGQADAVAKGMRLATGDILAYLNSDDILLEGALAAVIQFFECNPEIDAVYSNRVFVDEDDSVTRFWILPPHSNYCMSRWDFIPQETCFWRRSLMERAGPVDPRFQFALDYDLFVRMMKVGRFARLNRFLAGFRVHPAAKSSTLYETLGRREIDRVRRQNGIQIHWHDPLLKYLFGGPILGISFVVKLLAIRGIRRRLRFPYAR